MRVDEPAEDPLPPRCQVIGLEDAENRFERQTLAALARLFADDPTVILLCNPSLAHRRTGGPPDVVLVHPEAGVHVFEVKGVALSQVQAEPVGGQFTIQYRSGQQRKNPFKQAADAMFRVRDAASDLAVACGPLRLRFESWVVLTNISRAAWADRWGPAAFAPPNLLFADDVNDPALAVRLGVRSRAAGHAGPIELCPLDQLQCVMRAFGDNAVLYASPAADRPPRPRRAVLTLGDRLDAAAEVYRGLSDEQDALSRQDWRGGPRQVRGVAGSGKTVVLANNLARRLARSRPADDGGLFAEVVPPADRLLAVCFNQALVPYIRRRIEVAYQQRTGQALPRQSVDVCHLNGLAYELSRQGVWAYRRVPQGSGPDDWSHYLRELDGADPDVLARIRYNAIYVDEGQDFAPDQYRVLIQLCRPGPGGEPDLYVFYDDAQNLYGRPRPTWASLGLNVLGGRSHRMDECFRNTRPIVDAAFNVLYASHAPAGANRPTREFADLAHLEQKQLIVRDGSAWRVRFARREGPPPAAYFTPGGRPAETAHLIARLRWMLGEQQVRPEDVLVLAQRQTRVRELASAFATACLPGVRRVRSPMDSNSRGRPLVERGELAVSTVHSAKGYDAPCVMLATADSFGDSVEDRATFYVGCTRAAEHLEMSACRRAGLAVEFEAAVADLSAGGEA